MGKTSVSSSSTSKKEKQPEAMDITLNLKRRREIWESLREEEGEKKHCKKPSEKPSQQQQIQTHPQPETRSQPQPKEKNYKTKTSVQSQRLVQIISPPQQENAPTQPTETPLFPTLPSLSPISTSKIFPWSHSVSRETMPSTSKQRAKSASDDVQRALNAFYFNENVLQSPTIEHHVKKSLNPLISLKTIDHKDVTNPYFFRGTPMVTTLVRSAGNRTKEL